MSVSSCQISKPPLTAQCNGFSCQQAKNRKFWQLIKSIFRFPTPLPADQRSDPDHNLMEIQTNYCVGAPSQTWNWIASMINLPLLGSNCFQEIRRIFAVTMQDMKIFISSVQLQRFCVKNKALRFDWTLFWKCFQGTVSEERTVNSLFAMGNPILGVSCILESLSAVLSDHLHD